MKVLKRDSVLYKKIKKLEEYLVNNSLEIRQGYRGIIIEDIGDKRELEVIDTDDKSGVDTFPHPFEYDLKITE